MSSPLDGNSILGEFSVSGGSLTLSVKDLRFFRGYSHDSYPDDDDLPVIPMVKGKLYGVGSLGDNSISVVGSDQPATNSLAMTIKSYTDLDELAKEFAEHLQISGGIKNVYKGDDGEKIVEMLHRAYSLFDGNPPSATIFKYGGNWSLECSIPKIVFDTLERDYLDGRVQSLKLWVKPCPSLNDDKYGLSGTVSFGILRDSEYDDDGMGHGWATDLSWEVTGEISSEVKGCSAPHSDEKPEVTSAEPEVLETSEEPTVPDNLIQDLVSNLHLEIHSLASTTRRGFVFVLVLILLMALIRLT